MNLSFNEISFLPLQNDEYSLRKNFYGLLKTFEKAKRKHGFKHIIFPLNIGESKVADQKTLHEWVYNLSNQSEKNLILSIIKRPFCEEILNDKIDALSRFTYENEQEGIEEQYCYGLGTAYTMHLLSVSLPSPVFIDKSQINFYKIINDNFEKENLSVLNISTEEHLDLESVQEFITYLGDVNLIEDVTEPAEKPIVLRDDHGKDKLLAFSKKLRTSKYVTSVINSLPFNPNSINLIKKIYADGKIEMVLYWEDKGIGLIIQTTGRNYRETEEIATILRKEYDR